MFKSASKLTIFFTRVAKVIVQFIFNKSISRNKIDAKFAFFLFDEVLKRITIVKLKHKVKQQTEKFKSIQ